MKKSEQSDVFVLHRLKAATQIHAFNYANLNKTPRVDLLNYMQNDGININVSVQLQIYTVCEARISQYKYTMFDGMNKNDGNERCHSVKCM